MHEQTAVGVGSSHALVGPGTALVLVLRTDCAAMARAALVRSQAPPTKLRLHPAVGLVKAALLVCYLHVYSCSPSTTLLIQKVNTGPTRSHTDTHELHGETTHCKVIKASKEDTRASNASSRRHHAAGGDRRGVRFMFSQRDHTTDWFLQFFNLLHRSTDSRATDLNRSKHSF